jgi:hypothetical protein
LLGRAGAAGHQQRQHSSKPYGQKKAHQESILSQAIFQATRFGVL